MKIKKINEYLNGEILTSANALYYITLAVADSTTCLQVTKDEIQKILLGLNNYMLIDELVTSKSLYGMKIKVIK